MADNAPMSSASAQIDNNTSLGVAIEQFSNGSIIIAPDDHTEENVLSFLPLNNRSVY